MSVASLHWNICPMCTFGQSIHKVTHAGWFVRTSHRDYNLFISCMYSKRMPNIIRQSMRETYHEMGRVYNLGSDVSAIANLIFKSPTSD
jgi:hypothetical protein